MTTMSARAKAEAKLLAKAAADAAKAEAEAEQQASPASPGAPAIVVSSPGSPEKPKAQSGLAATLRAKAPQHAAGCRGRGRSGRVEREDVEHWNIGTLGALRTGDRTVTRRGPWSGVAHGRATTRFLSHGRLCARCTWTVVCVCSLDHTGGLGTARCAS